MSLQHIVVLVTLGIDSRTGRSRGGFDVVRRAKARTAFRLALRWPILFSYLARWARRRSQCRSSESSSGQTLWRYVLVHIFLRWLCRSSRGHARRHCYRLHSRRHDQRPHIYASLRRCPRSVLSANGLTVKCSSLSSREMRACCTATIK